MVSRNNEKLSIPEFEVERLQALRALKVLDTPAEERFDRLTRLGQKHFGTPIVALSLVDESRQWFKSIQGLCALETSREVSFCQYTVMNCDEALVIEDARKDHRFANNPLVTGEPGIVFYAGYPVRDPSGLPVASFCVIDTVPHQFGPAQISSLRDFAALAESELAHMRLGESQKDLISKVGHLQLKAHVDSLTRVWNRGAVMEVLKRELARSARVGTDVGLILLDIDHFKAVNDTYGHLGGDEALRQVARELRGAVREYDAVGRYGGEEFLVVAPECAAKETSDLAERIRRRIQDSLPTLGGQKVEITASMGTATAGQDGTQVEELLNLADSRLYKAKAAGRNRVESL